MDDVMARVDEGETRRQLLVGLAQDIVADALREAGYPQPETLGVDLLVDALVAESLRHYR